MICAKKTERVVQVNLDLSMCRITVYLMDYICDLLFMFIPDKMVTEYLQKNELVLHQSSVHSG